MKRHQCQRRCSRITAWPSSQATMDSGENQTSSSMTSSRPLAAGWRAARGIGWPGVACQPPAGFLEGRGGSRGTSMAGEALVAGAGHLGQRMDLDGMARAGCAGAGRSGSRRPRAGRSRRSAASGHAGAGSRPPAAGRRPCGSARPRPRPAWGAGRRPRRTARSRRRVSGSSGSWMAASGTWLLPASRRSSRSDSQRPPSGMLGSRASRTTPTAWTWASWGMTKDQAAHVQADQPQRLGGGGDPLESEQPVSSDQAAVLPTAQDLAQGLLAQLPRDLRGAGRQPAEQHPEHVGAGRVLLAQPAQGGHIPLGDAGVNVPTRTPGAAVPGSGAARWWSVAGAVDPWAGSSAASTIEALIRHRGRPPAGGPPLGVLARRPGGRGTQPRRRR